MYIIGQAVGGWDWGANAVDMIPTNSQEGQFWAIRYIKAGEGFKFNSKKEWGGDFWGLDNNEGFTEDGGNCVVAEDGVYMILVDVKNGNVCIEPAKVYGIGGCFGGWDAGSTAFSIEATRLSEPQPQAAKSVCMPAALPPLLTGGPVNSYSSTARSLIAAPAETRSA